MLLIQNAKVLTVTNGTFPKGDILIDGGKIIRVAEKIDPPAGAELLDACGRWVMPGMIDCHTHLGLDELYHWDDINELNEMGDPITPALRCVDGFYADDPAVMDALAAGVTSVIVHTGSIQVISGQSASYKLIPCKETSKMVLNPCVGIKGGFGGTPKRFYCKLHKIPSTRMGEAAVMRQALADAVAYRDGWRPEGDGLWEQEEKLKALQPLINGQTPWRVHVYKLHDIYTCMRIAEEFGIRMVLEHGGESPMIAKQLAEKNIYVTVGPSGFIGSVKPETFYPVIEHVQELEDAGVIFSFQTDHPIITVASLPQAVAMLVRNGLDEGVALKALTINAAIIMGEEKRLGSIEPGKDADLVIATGSIFDHQTFVDQVLINGETVFDRLTANA